VLILVIDTSLQGITIGLARQEGKAFKILEIYGSSLPQEATARLPELCQRVLHQHNANLSGIGALVVSHGPGSFTGIKIGLSFAAGWKRAGTAIKVYGVSSFQALFKQIPTEAFTFRSLLLPATQTAGYFALRENSGLKADPHLGVLDLSAATAASLVDATGLAVKDVASAELGPALILGAWPRLETWLSSQKIPWKGLETDTLYKAVVTGMLEEFIAKSNELSEADLKPIYLRKSAPEEKLDNLAKAKNETLV